MSQPLPPELRQQLDAFKRRLFVQESLWAAGIFLSGPLAAAALLFLFDRFENTPQWVRLTLLLGSLAVAAYGAGRWLVLWVLHPRDDRRLSVLVQRKYRKLGDSLLSAIELAEGRITDDTISPELREAAVASVARQASSLDFVRAVNWRATARIAAGAAAGLALAVVLGLACMPALRATLARFLNPFAEVVRHTFTRFKPMSPEMVVARGEPFTVPCEIDETSQWKPPTVNFQVGAGRPGQVAPGKGIAVPGQTEEVALKVWAGDAKESVNIRPETRPALTGIKARVDLPAYLRLPPVETPCGGSLTTVEGAQVTLFGQATRELKGMEALAAAKASAADPKDPKAAQPETKPETAAPAVALAPTFSSTGFSLAKVEAKGETQVTLSWTDVLGLAGAAPHAVAIKARPDKVPESRINDMASSLAMLPDQTVAMGLEAADDFGVKTMGIRVRYAATKDLAKDQTKEPATWTEVPFVPAGVGAPDKARLSADFSFSPKLLGIPEGHIAELRLGSADYCPDHAEGLSEPRYIKIVTQAEHSELLQGLMADASSKAEDIANTERELKDQIADLAKDPSKLATPEGQKKLAEIKAAEKKNAEEMRKLDEKVQAIAKEVAKNKEAPKDALKKLAEMSQDLKDAAKASDKAAEAMDKAQQAKSPEEAKKELEEAGKQEKEAEEKLRKNSKKMDELQRQFDASNFANRLKREASQQDARTAEALKLQVAMIGKTQEMMTQEEKDAVKALAEGQAKSMAAAKAIASDLAASYARSHHEPYHAITDDMEKQGLDARNGFLIGEFQGGRVSQAAGKGKELAALYRAWAEMLKDKNGGGGGGGGGGGAQLPAELLAAFMHMIESEQDLRDETRAAGDMAVSRREALDAKVADKAVDAAAADKEEAAIAKEAADASGVLAEEQIEQLRYLARTYKEWADPPENERAVDMLPEDFAGPYGALVEGKRPLPQKVLQLMNRTAGAMEDSAKRLKGGHPDSVAIAAQTEVIELMASIFDQDGGGSSSKSKAGPPSPSAQMGKQMAKGKGKGKGNQPGMGGDGTGRADKEKDGGSHAEGSGPRDVSKAGGAAGGFVPPEFQGDIDAYHAEADKMEDKP